MASRCKTTTKIFSNNLTKYCGFISQPWVPTTESKSKALNQNYFMGYCYFIPQLWILVVDVEPKLSLDWFCLMVTDSCSKTKTRTVQNYFMKNYGFILHSKAAQIIHEIP